MAEIHPAHGNHGTGLTLRSAADVTDLLILIIVLHRRLSHIFRNSLAALVSVLCLFQIFFIFQNLISFYMLSYM